MRPRRSLRPFPAAGVAVLLAVVLAPLPGCTREGQGSGAINAPAAPAPPARPASGSEASAPAHLPESPAMPAPAASSPREAAAGVVAALAARDLARLATWVDPERGVRFSPYGYVEPEGAVTLRPDELLAAWGDGATRTWGSYDGSGDPIELSFPDYFDRFVWDVDYTDPAAEIAVDRRLGQGNSLDNSREAYPGASIVELHLPGRDPKYGGMDWRSLRLALVPDGATWRLVGIIHDEWTI